MSFWNQHLLSLKKTAIKGIQSRTDNDYFPLLLVTIMKSHLRVNYELLQDIQVFLILAFGKRIIMVTQLTKFMEQTVNAYNGLTKISVIT